jgi:hypothetical protein
MVCLRNICVNILHKGDSIFINNNNNNNNNNKFSTWLLILRVNSQMASYINITKYIHKLSKDSKQDTKEADNIYTKNTTQTEQKQYGRKINAKDYDRSPKPEKNW